MPALHRMISRFSLVCLVAAAAFVAGVPVASAAEAGMSWTMMPRMLDALPAPRARTAALLARTVPANTQHTCDPLPDAESPPGVRGTTLHEARDSHQCEPPRDPCRHPGG